MAHCYVPPLAPGYAEAKKRVIAPLNSTYRKAIHEFRRPFEPLLATCDPNVANDKAEDTARATLPRQQRRRGVRGRGLEAQAPHILVSGMEPAPWSVGKAVRRLKELRDEPGPPKFLRRLKKDRAGLNAESLKGSAPDLSTVSLLTRGRDIKREIFHFRAAARGGAIFTGWDFS